MAGITALQALRDVAQVRPGQKVLVNGAGGGVGTFAVQVAKALGAEVTAVTNTGSVALVRSLGADRVIDYTQEDFTQGVERYDVILDMSGNHSLGDYRRVLTPQGAYVLAGDTSKGAWLGPLASFGSRHRGPVREAETADDHGESEPGRPDGARRHAADR